MGISFFTPTLTPVSVFCFPAEVTPAEGVVFGVHVLPGDALVLLFLHLLGILVGWVQHPDFEQEMEK